MNPQTQKTKKLENAKKYKEMYRANWLIGYRSSKNIWSMKIVLEKHFKENLVDESTSTEPWVKPRAGKPRHVHVISCTTKEAEEREFVVDSGASMHMVSKRDLNSAELETMRTSRSPTVMTANGEVQTREKATENVKQLDLFVKVMLLEETLAVLSLEKLCEEHGYTYHWTTGQKPHLTKKGKIIDGNTSNCVPSVVLGLSTSSSLTPTPPSSSSSQDSLFDASRYTENPASERSGSTSEELR